MTCPIFGAMVLAPDGGTLKFYNSRSQVVTYVTLEAHTNPRLDASIDLVHCDNVQIMPVLSKTILYIDLMSIIHIVTNYFICIN